MNLVMFDVDGTLVDSAGFDDPSAEGSGPGMVQQPPAVYRVARLRVCE